MFLFAVGYGVGPQFVRGVAKDGLPQALFSVVQCVLCLASAVVIAKFAGYDLGYAAGLYAGSQTISASMGLATDAINRLGLAADQAKALLDAMPVAYAVTYMFGTVGSAIVIALVGPALLGIDLPAACKDYEAKQRRRQGSRRGRIGLAPLGAARLPRADRAGRPSASGPSRPRPWCPTRGSSSSASAARMGRSRTPPPTP